jgi:hypothetical protein
MVAVLSAGPEQLGLPDIALRLHNEVVYPEECLGGGRDASVFRYKDMVSDMVAFPSCVHGWEQMLTACQLAAHQCSQHGIVR